MAANQNSEFWNIPYDVTATKWERFCFWLMPMVLAYIYPQVIYIAIDTFIGRINEGAHLGIDPVWAIAFGFINCGLLHIYMIFRRKCLEKYGFMLLMYKKDCKRAHKPL